MVRRTAQKELVKRTVIMSCDHPTAQTVYERARLQMPNISLGTVYRILRQLVAMGEVLEVGVDGASSRYDKTAFDHAHFVCRECGEVTDIDADIVGILNSACCHSPHNIESARLTFYGECEACKSRRIAKANE